MAKRPKSDTEKRPGMWSAVGESSLADGHMTDAGLVHLQGLNQVRAFALGRSWARPQRFYKAGTGLSRSTP
jgi:hypothetical protein